MNVEEVKDQILQADLKTLLALQTALAHEGVCMTFETAEVQVIEQATPGKIARTNRHVKRIHHEKS